MPKAFCYSCPIHNGRRYEPEPLYTNQRRASHEGCGHSVIERYIPQAAARLRKVAEAQDRHEEE